MAIILKNLFFSVTLNNTSANNVAIDILKMNLMPMFSGVLFRVHCTCHILNLCIKDGLKVAEPHIEEVRNCTLYVRNGSHGRHEFQSYCSERGRNVKHILLMLIIGKILLMKYWIVPMMIEILFLYFVMISFPKT